MEEARFTLRSFKHFEELLIRLELDCDKNWWISEKLNSRPSLI